MCDYVSLKLTYLLWVISLLGYFLGQFVHFLAILADIWQNLVYLECHGRQCHSPTPKALRTNVCAFSLCLNICLLGCENKLEEKFSFFQNVLLSNVS